jgi:hypothetical protein
MDLDLTEPSPQVADRAEGPLTEAERDIVIAALAAGATQAEAGRLVARSARSVRRWQQDDPTFKTEVNERRTDRAAALAGRLTEMGDQATRVLQAALEDENARVRVRAAELILSSGVRLRRAAELDDALEEVLTFARELQATYEDLQNKGKAT